MNQKNKFALTISIYTFATALYNTYQERQREWPDEALATFQQEKVPIPISIIIGKQISQIQAENILTIFKSSSDLSEELFVSAIAQSFLISFKAT